MTVAYLVCVKGGPEVLRNESPPVGSRFIASVGGQADSPPESEAYVLINEWLNFHVLYEQN